MGIKINMSNAKIGGNTQVLNNAQIAGNADATVEMNGIEVQGNAAVLNNLRIDPFLDELQSAVDRMDLGSPEYRSMRQIVESRDKDRDTILGMIAKHIGMFSQGVLENVLAAYISRGW